MGSRVPVPKLTRAEGYALESLESTAREVGDTAFHLCRAADRSVYYRRNGGHVEAEYVDGFIRRAMVALHEHRVFQDGVELDHPFYRVELLPRGAAALLVWQEGGRSPRHGRRRPRRAG